MTHVVTRPLPTANGTLEVGTEVNASKWRNARLLESQRYIKPLPQKKKKAKENQ